ncbi:MAG: TadA family conjugal transfer-associated ATPase [Nocardioidaceae bacterium]
MTVSATTEVSADLLERVREVLASQGAPPTPARVAMALRSQGLVHGDAEVLAVVDALRRDTVGAGPLEPLLRLPGVTDVLVNGPRHVYLDRGEGLEPAPVSFLDDASVRRLAQRLASAGGRRLDDATPFVDVRLGDGTRFHAVLSPVARPGTCLSLRVPSQQAFALDELVAAGTLSSSSAALLGDIVAAEVAFLISGGTGAGKTTLLSALLSRVNPVHRLVLVEDSGELRPDHAHVVSLEARPPNVEGAGAITLRDLVRQALRMRPDRLVVGEVRGAEVTDLLAALNTGHQGGCGTIHANSAADVPARLEALGVAAGLSRQAVHSQLASALQVVLHLRRDQGGVRRLSEICVLARDSTGFVTAEPAVRFAADGSSQAGPGAQGLELLLGGR